MFPWAKSASPTRNGLFYLQSDGWLKKTGRSTEGFPLIVKNYAKSLCPGRTVEGYCVSSGGDFNNGPSEACNVLELLFVSWKCTGNAVALDIFIVKISITNFINCN